MNYAIVMIYIFFYILRDAYDWKCGHWRAHARDGRLAAGGSRGREEGGDVGVRTAPDDTRQAMIVEGGRVEKRHEGICEIGGDYSTVKLSLAADGLWREWIKNLIWQKYLKGNRSAEYGISPAQINNSSKLFEANFFLLI